MITRVIIIGIGNKLEMEKYTYPAENMDMDRNIMAKVRKMENKRLSFYIFLSNIIYNLTWYFADFLDIYLGVFSMPYKFYTKIISFP